MYGTETVVSNNTINNGFENDVKMYGTETGSGGALQIGVFENDVKMYGTETMKKQQVNNGCLRMM